MGISTASKEKEEKEEKGTDVKKTDVSATAEKQDKPEVVVDEDSEPQHYVWLSNGSVKRVNESDVQTLTHPFGHWQSGDKVYEIVAVYPVENTVKDAK